eukprot:2032611-Heterocapsa_arctica.AAC.1
MHSVAILAQDFSCCSAGSGVLCFTLGLVACGWRGGCHCGTATWPLWRLSACSFRMALPAPYEVDGPCTPPHRRARSSTSSTCRHRFEQDRFAFKVLTSIGRALFVFV